MQNSLLAIVIVLGMFAIKGLRIGLSSRLTSRPRLITRKAQSTTTTTADRSILPLSLEQLTTIVNGSGKARLIWEDLRKGIDPLAEESSLTKSGRVLLKEHILGGPIIPAKIDSESVAACGTRKMLLKLKDGQSIETVIIPSPRGDYSTLCVSTQLGCDRRCAFCATGTMGLLRNLSASEILAQVVHSIQVARREFMPTITNVVFMGMGDSAGNIAAVRDTVHCLTDPNRLNFSPNKISVSTVGPNPDCFMQLAAMPCALAWSLHSPDNAVRKLLVPSTRHTTEELRDGLIKALLSRPETPHGRSVLVAFTLIAGVNDALSDADRIVEFMRPLQAVASKLVINLIPYNDIQLAEGVVPTRVSSVAVGFARPSNATVWGFQRHLRSKGMFCSVRSTRGEEEAAACGMLATRRVRRVGTAVGSTNGGSTNGGTGAGLLVEGLEGPVTTIGVSESVSVVRTSNGSDGDSHNRQAEQYPKKISS